jgi:hypothetical protein
MSLSVPVTVAASEGRARRRKSGERVGFIVFVVSVQ